ncbi:ATP-binding protein [Alsobacter sp. SYSU M60028]|uniref:histidine kinase n=1 Tax=Alsobacter ponti TaxID=2962936 RepID=A0ABT1L6K9_9HYPH|nr:ATP-binding protein [Alsobacter ponti]MCP8937032.1 ATP-binding protein [Alsobacter ponti]
MRALALVKQPASLYRKAGRWLAGRMPKGLYARALIIIIAPMVILQSVLAYAFMERHWQTVTRRLSAAVTQDIAGLIQVAESYPQDPNYETLSRIASDSLNLDMEILPRGPLPPPGPKPFFSILDSTLSRELRQQIGKPFWIDTVGRSNLIEIRIQLDFGVMRILTRRSQAYASNSHIFLMWMVGTSLVLIAIAIVFLRNQIRPVLRLAEAAEAFGKGQEIDFHPRGAREVRQAGHAFIEMRRRVERAIEQRTAMLNGVSHDLRTILTRFKLSTALMDEDTPELDDIKKDIDEMSRMLEAYLAFARGDAGEASAPVDMGQLLEELKTDAERTGHATQVMVSGDPVARVRPDAFKRCIGNLVANAARHGEKIAITATRDPRWLSITVDDDGPGIPVGQREEVFRPFVRLDESRNVDEGGTGLGLAIARDIARSHGGDILLGDSPLGGLRATVRVPV